MVAPTIGTSKNDIKRSQARIMGKYNNWNYWLSLFLLATVLAFVLPVFYVFRSNVENKILDYFKHVGIIASWFGGAIVLIWIMESTLFRQ